MSRSFVIRWVFLFRSFYLLTLPCSAPVLFMAHLYLHANFTTLSTTFWYSHFRDVSLFFYVVILISLPCEDVSGGRYESLNKLRLNSMTTLTTIIYPVTLVSLRQPPSIAHLRPARKKSWDAQKLNLLRSVENCKKQRRKQFARCWSSQRRIEPVLSNKLHLYILVIYF